MASIRVGDGQNSRLSSLQQIDAVCDEYERDLTKGTIRPVNDYLSQVDSSNAQALLRELSILHRNAEEMVAESGTMVGRSTARNATNTRCDLAKLRLPTPSAANASECFRFKNYTLLSKIGSGASGVVFLAEDIDLKTPVAIKLPLTDCVLNSAEHEGFVREARNAVRLKHPGILRVLRVGVWQDTPFIVTEYVPGKNLKTWLQQASPKLSFREIARLVAEIAEAIDHAHKQGVVHRDLKPSNIVVEEQVSPPTETHNRPTRLKPCIMDFGISKITDTINSRTMQGDILGTPAYMSPEQASGGSQEADGRSDIYSLGIILYELLAGENPFRGSTVQVLAQIQQGKIPPIQSKVVSVPKPLAAICHRCLELRPQDRYETAAQLAEVLRQWLAGLKISARPSPVRWLAKHKNSVIRVAAILALFAFGLAGWIDRDNGNELLEIKSSIESANKLKVLDRELVDFVKTGQAKALPELVRSLKGREQNLRDKLLELWKAKPTKFAEDFQGEMLALHYSRFAFVLYLLGDQDPLWSHLKSAADPRMQTYLINWLAEAGGNMVESGYSFDPMFERLKVETEPSLQYALLLVLGHQYPEYISDDRALVDWAKSAYERHPDSGVHSACLWLLARRGETSFLQAADERSRHEGIVPGRNWHVSPSGILMIHCRPPDNYPVGADNYPVRTKMRNPPYFERRRTGIAAPHFAMSAFEAPEEIWTAMEETSGIPLFSHPQSLPLLDVSAVEAFDVCRWLNRIEGFLSTDEPATEIVAGAEIHQESFFVDIRKRGYRLPTDVEWEFAAKANSELDIFYGTSETKASAIYIALGNNLLATQAIPNAFGFFGILNSAREWTCTPTLGGESLRYSNPVQIKIKEGLVLGGSSFVNELPHFRRSFMVATHRLDKFAFRLCRSLD